MRIFNSSVNRVVSVVLAFVLFFLALFLPSTSVNASDPLNEARTYYRYDSSSGDYLGSYTLSDLSLDSSSTDVSTMNVYGDTDDRVENYDRNGVVKITTTSGNFGSGFVVSDHVIATAAHCVVSRDAKSHENCDVTIENIFCFNGSNTPSLTISKENIVEVHAPSLYIDGNDENEYKYDYALIIVKDDLSKYTCFNLGTMLDDYLGEVTVAGFPGNVSTDGSEKEANTLTKHKLYIAIGNVTEQDEYVVKYDADMTAGQSGGPVYATTKFNGKTYYTVIGINTYETTYEDKVAGYNFGTRITPSLMQFYLANPYV